MFHKHLYKEGEFLPVVIYWDPFLDVSPHLQVSVDTFFLRFVVSLRGEGDVVVFALGGDINPHAVVLVLFSVLGSPCSQDKSEFLREYVFEDAFWQSGSPYFV